MSNKENTSMIENLFNQFIENGGEPKVTAFKRHLNELINSDIKQLCGRSGKASAEGGWRHELKAKFSGKGAKWVLVPLDEINPTIMRLESEGIDCEAYKTFIEAKGSAWIRFAGSRVAMGKQCAAFEVRTGGSKIDHPKQLHLIPVTGLDETISPMSNGTPHSLKYEVIAQPDVATEVKSDDSVSNDNTVTLNDVVIGSIVKEEDDNIHELSNCDEDFGLDAVDIANLMESENEEL